MADSQYISQITLPNNKPYLLKAASVPLSGVTGADDLKAIEALSGTNGLLRKTATNTWALDTNDTITIGGNPVALGGSISLADLGLSSAMHYKGIVTEIPTTSGTYISGDVVVLQNTDKEYVYDGTSWRELGSEGSYKLRQTAINDPTVINNIDSTTFISTISQNSNGEITATKANLPLGNTTTAGIVKLGASGGAAAYNHTHTTILTTGDNNDVSQLALLPNTKYKLTTGDTNYIFTTPIDTKVEIIHL